MNKSWQIKERRHPDLREHLLTLRSGPGREDQETFLNPPRPPSYLENPEKIGLDANDLRAAADLIRAAMTWGRTIIIHGDYDVDGLCATAILWQTIYKDLAYKNCLPFIPNRFDHGYGLSTESIDSLSSLRPPLADSQGVALLIAVDCGITAVEAVEYAKEKGFEVLVVDHHAKPEKLPKCQILWTEKMCAAGLSWVLSQSLLQGHPLRMDLVALATIADLQPLTGFNRSLVKFGLEELNQTKNVGLKTLIKSAGIEGRKIGVLEIGWILAPRLNAAGRLESALKALRLLCTTDASQAQTIAEELNEINRQRQSLTATLLERAKNLVGEDWSKVKVVVGEEFHEGIIGLIAGKLAQEFGLPAVVISRGPEFSKASARSVTGFDVVAFLRSLGDHFQDIGGHAGAAGFTIRTEKIESFLSAVKSHESDVILPEQNLNVDAEINFEEINDDLWSLCQSLAPFGLDNPEPVFLLSPVRVAESRTVGARNQHLKLRVSPLPPPAQAGRASTDIIDCIGFDLGERIKEVWVGEKIDLAFYLYEDTFSGNLKLSLKLKDLRKSEKS